MKIKCGIIGCGVIAPSHAEAYQQIDGVEIKWACDIVRGRAEKLASKYNINSVTEKYSDLLYDKELDCVSVCTDHGSHPEICIDALEHGKHLICEKALATSSGALDRMEEASIRHPELVFSGVFQHRFDGVYQFLKDLVDKKAFGKILIVNTSLSCLRNNEYYTADNWRGTWRQEGGSILINQAIHFIDLADWIMGGIDHLSGEYANLTHEGVIETEDTATANVHFKCGALGQISATCSGNSEWDSSMSIRGSEGFIMIRKSKIIDFEFINPETNAIVRSFCANPEDKSRVIAGKTYYGTSHPAQIADFIDAIRNKRQPFVPFASARRAVDIVLAIYKSHREDRRIRTT